MGDCDVLVIGAGVSGLFAAYRLQKHNLTVKVIEAKDRVGGRLLAKKLPAAWGHDTWDIGGQWVCSSQPNVMHLIKELGLEVYGQFNEGKKQLMLSNGKVRTYSSFIPNINPLELIELNSCISKLNKLCDSVVLKDVSKTPDAVNLDSITLHTFVRDVCQYDTTREIFESVVRIVFGVTTGQISLLWVLYYSKQAGGFFNLLEVDNAGAQEFRIKNGAYGIALKLGDIIGKENLHFSDPVTRIDQNSDGKVKTSTLSGKCFTSKFVISALPPHLVSAISFSPPLPFHRTRLVAQMPVGHIIKFVITFKDAFWKENGFSGETLCNTATFDSGPITCTYDATTANGNPAIVGFICAEHAYYWSQQNVVSRKEAVLKQLSCMLGSKCLSPIHYEEFDWAKVPYNGGCPVSNLMPGSLLYHDQTMRLPFKRVHWAGTEIAEAWCGYIEGALESSERCIKEVLDDWSKSSIPTTYPAPPPIFNMPKKTKKRSCRGSVIGGIVIASLTTVAAYYIIKKYKG